MCIAITRSCAINPFLFKILDYRFFDTPFLQKFAHLNRVTTVYDYQIKKDTSTVNECTGFLLQMYC